MGTPLIFLTSNLQNPLLYKQYHLPLEFIAFGITEGRMYKHYRNADTFIVPVNSKRTWGNSVIYGGLFVCPDMDFYLRIFDAYHVCSLNTLGRNHIKDMQHRIISQITLIRFNTLDELARLKYKEGEAISAYTYIGNLNHPNLMRRVYREGISYRIIDGINAMPFKNLFREVNK